MEKFLKQLYIPHGSDETEGEKISDLKLIQLYIPHGSDETEGEKISDLKLIQLYIPHGSDEPSILNLTNSH